MTDEQDLAEQLDQDELDAGDFPPDRSVVSELLSEDVTAAGSYAPDTIGERDLRIEPELRGTDDPEGAVPFELQEDGEPAEADGDVVDALDLSEVPHHGPADTLPAEEAALHVVDEPR